MRRGAFVAGGDELEEQVRGFGFEGDVADFVDDEQRVAAEADQFVLEPAGVVGVGEAVDPLAAVANSTRWPAWQARIAEADGEVGFAGAGRAEEHDVLFGGDEVQGAQVGDRVAFEAAGVVEVELLQGLAGREPGGADAALAAVGLPGGDLALQAGGEELLMGPGLRPGPFGQPFDRRRAGSVLSTPGSGTRSRRQVTAGLAASVIRPPSRRRPSTPGPSGRSRPKTAS